MPRTWATKPPSKATDGVVDRIVTVANVFQVLGGGVAVAVNKRPRQHRLPDGIHQRPIIVVPDGEGNHRAVALFDAENVRAAGAG